MKLNDGSRFITNLENTAESVDLWKEFLRKGESETLEVAESEINIRFATFVIFARTAVRNLRGLRYIISLLNCSK